MDIIFVFLLVWQLIRLGNNDLGGELLRWNWKKKASDTDEHIHHLQGNFIEELVPCLFIKILLLLLMLCYTWIWILIFIVMIRSIAISSLSLPFPFSLSLSAQHTCHADSILETVSIRSDPVILHITLPYLVSICIYSLIEMSLPHCRDRKSMACTRTKGLGMLSCLI